MRQIRCDGCGLTESDEIIKDRKIKSTTLIIVEDTRFSQGIQEHKADLCGQCRGEMLHNYFNEPAQGTLEVPGFIKLANAN